MTLDSDELMIDKNSEKGSRIDKLIDALLAICDNCDPEEAASALGSAYFTYFYNHKTSWVVVSENLRWLIYKYKERWENEDAWE